MRALRAGDIDTPPDRIDDRLIYRVRLPDGREGSVTVADVDDDEIPASAEWVAEALNDLVRLQGEAALRVGVLSGALVLRWVEP